MGSTLHSRYSATQIIKHVASEIHSKIVSSIIASSSKLAVLIDETSSLSHKAVMTVSVFTEEWLHENWVIFVSDGASVMLGKKSGVADLKIPKCFRMALYEP